MAKKCMLISVVEREILTEQFDTLEDAHRVMLKEMKDAGAPDEIFEEDEYDDGECGFGEDCGYVTDGWNHSNYDWRIVIL